MKAVSKRWQVTRFCCTSGFCVDCHQRGNDGSLARRQRIVHADRLTLQTARKMARGWASYEAEAVPMDASAPIPFTDEEN